MKKYVYLLFLFYIFNITCYSQWTAIGPGGGSLFAITSSGNNVAVSAYGGGVFTSSNSGISWSLKQQGLSSVYVWALDYSSDSLFAGTNKGVFLSTNNGSNWTQLSLTRIINSILILDDKIFCRHIRFRCICFFKRRC